MLNVNISLSEEQSNPLPNGRSNTLARIHALYMYLGKKACSALRGNRVGVEPNERGAESYSTV